MGSLCEECLHNTGLDKLGFFLEGLCMTPIPHQCLKSMGPVSYEEKRNVYVKVQNFSVHFHALKVSLISSSDFGGFYASDL